MDLVFKYIEDFLHTALWKYHIKYISYPYKVNIYLQVVQRFNSAAIGVLRWKSLHSYEMVFFLYSLKFDNSAPIEHTIFLCNIYSVSKCLCCFHSCSTWVCIIVFLLSLIFLQIMGGMFFLQTYSACHLKVTLPNSRFSTEYWHWEEFVFIDGKTYQYWREHSTY